MSDELRSLFTDLEPILNGKPNPGIGHIDPETAEYFAKRLLEKRDHPEPRNPFVDTTFEFTPLDVLNSRSFFQFGNTGDYALIVISHALKLADKLSEESAIDNLQIRKGTPTTWEFDLSINQSIPHHYAIEHEKFTPELLAERIRRDWWPVKGAWAIVSNQSRIT